MNFARGSDEACSLRHDGRPSIGSARATHKVRALITMLRRARWAMTGGGFIGLFITIGYIVMLSPSYTATAKILFSPDQPPAVDREEAAVDPSHDGLQNKIEILRSTHLMRRVVERTALYEYPAFNPALFNPALRDSGGGTGGAAAFFDMPAALLRLVSQRPAAAGNTPAVPPSPADTETAGRLLAGSLWFNPVPDTRVIAISARTGDPDLSVTVVNAVASAYTATQLDMKLAAAREATAWLSDRAAELKDELGAADAKVARVRSSLAAPNGRDTAQVQAELHALEQAVAAAATARAAAEIRYRTVRAAIERKDAGMTSGELHAFDLVRPAEVRTREYAVERVSLAQLVPEGDARAAPFDATLAEVRRNTLEDSEQIALVRYNEVVVEAARERRLRDDTRALQALLDGRKEDAAKLREHERDAAATRILYESFLARLKATAQYESYEADAVIISPAERPGSADDSAQLPIAALGGMLGLIGGLAYTMVAERLNNTFRSLEDIEAMTGLPVLGAIPFMANAERYGGVLDYVMQRPDSALAEAIRSLRTSLLCSDFDPPQVVMFTSSLPAEGKSTTSLLLAVASAQMGKSTIIVDCDLRRPTLSGLLGALGSARGGLRAILDGSLTLDEACLTDPDTGLVILPTRGERGGAAVNAADVLASTGFADLITLLRERYELVILDAPPTLSVTDARLIAQRADATVYCIRWDEVPRETVLAGLHEFSIGRPSLAGAVVTMVDTARVMGEGGDYRLIAGDPYHVN